MSLQLDELDTDVTDLNEVYLRLGVDFQNQYQRTNPLGQDYKNNLQRPLERVSVESPFERLNDLKNKLELKDPDVRSFTYKTKENESKDIIVLSHKVKRSELSEEDPNLRAIYIIDPNWNLGVKRNQFLATEVFLVNSLGTTLSLREEIGEREIIIEFNSQESSSSQITDSRLILRVLETEDDVSLMCHELGHGRSASLLPAEQENVGIARSKVNKKLGIDATPNPNIVITDNDEVALKLMFEREQEAWDKAEVIRKEYSARGLALCSEAVMQSQRDAALYGDPTLGRIGYDFYINLKEEMLWRSQELKVGLEIASVVRRLRNIYGDDLNMLLTRVADIQYDLKTFSDKQYSESEIKQGINTLEEVIVRYYGKVASSMWSQRFEGSESDRIFRQIERSIWFNWDSQRTLSENKSRFLTAYMYKTIFKSRFFFIRIMTHIQ